MNYALLLYAAPDAPARDRAVGADAFDNWVDYATAIREAGVLLAAERLHDIGSATTVRHRDGGQLVTDGPFAETKEHLLGFFLIDVPDLDAALNWAARMPFIGFGSVEVRPTRTGQPWQVAAGLAER